ncbi:MAG: HAD family phosphatase [Actinobacteria bacterium]|nr:MAG: HAD family phosphatase [Actinomycetota bacterium]
MARRGLLVDFGGVLTTDIFESFQAFCEAEGLVPDRVRTTFRSDDEGRQLLFDLELGKLSEAEFEKRFARHLGLAVERAPGLIDRLFGGMRPDRDMEMAVVMAKRQGIRTGLISNSWGSGRYELDRFPELFDGWVISGEEGIRKPDPAIYALGAERIGLPPEEIVFVDDLRGNLKPAREMGMATVHHVRAEETIRQLEELLDVKLGR